MTGRSSSREQASDVFSQVKLYFKGYFEPARGSEARCANRAWDCRATCPIMAPRMQPTHNRALPRLLAALFVCLSRTKTCTCMRDLDRMKLCVVVAQCHNSTY